VTTQKEIGVSLYRREFTREDWQYPLDQEALGAFLGRLATELEPFGIALVQGPEAELTIKVKGYGDLLNAVRIRSPKDGFSNLCLGHIIGASPNRDLFEDIRRGVNRVAFAPETIEPEGSNKVVCHNCGCGC